jgi:hypothetical protein
MDTDYDTSERDRLWQHRLHEDLMLSDRGNFFLVAESLFVVAYAELLATEDFAAAVVAGAAILLTAAWLMVSHRHRQIIRHVQARAIASLPEFRDTYATWPTGPLASTRLFATWVPLLLGLTWIFLLVIAVD